MNENVIAMTQKTVTLTHEIPLEKGKIVHTISYQLDLDGRPYNCQVKEVQEIGKYGQSINDFKISNSDLGCIMPQPDAELNADTVINQALFNYLSQEIKKIVGEWGHFWNIATLQPQLTYYAARIGMANEIVEALVQKVIESGFKPGVESLQKLRKENENFLRRERREEKRRLSLSETVYSSELHRIKDLVRYATGIQEGEKKIAAIKKEIEENIRQEAAQYFESDLEHAIALLQKEKDPEATNHFQVVDTFASYIHDLELFADYFSNGWLKLATLHQDCLDRTITLAEAALAHDNKKETAQRIGESRSFLYWFEESYRERQPKFPTAVMRESIQQLEQKIEQKYRRPWYDLLED